MLLSPRLKKKLGKIPTHITRMHTCINIWHFCLEETAKTPKTDLLSIQYFRIVEFSVLQNEKKKNTLLNASNLVPRTLNNQKTRSSSRHSFTINYIIIGCLADANKSHYTVISQNVAHKNATVLFHRLALNQIKRQWNFSNGKTLKAVQCNKFSWLLSTELIPILNFFYNLPMAFAYSFGWKIFFRRQ